jgi:predicted metalloprotease with PDZ domain
MAPLPLRKGVGPLAALGIACGLVGPALSGGALEAQDARAAVMRFRERPQGWIGVTFDLELREPWRGGAASGPPAMVITDIHPDSPAAKAGLRVGDSILSINREAVSNAALARLQSALEPGSPVSFTVRRGGAARTVSLRAERRPADELLVTLPPQVRIRLDSAQAVFLQHIDSAARLNVLVRPDASGVFVLRALGDSTSFVSVRAPDASVQPLPGQAFDRRWTAVAAPVPAPFPGVAPVVRGVPVDPARQASRAAEAVVTARQNVETQLEAVRRQMTASERALAELEEHRRPLAPYLLGQDWIAGARLTPVNPGLAPYFGVQGGLLVVDVAEGTPAWDAGLVAGDVILSAAGGRMVSSIEELRTLLTAPGARDAVPLTLVRKGRSLQVTLPR